jgi:CheY-like chemotaxis protein
VPAAGHRVLVVDDNEDFANSLALILRALDNEVRVAHDGATALELVQRWQPQIGFLDIGLPRINGYDLARRLRANAGTASMVLVAVTGWGQEEDRRRTEETGFDYHLIKPVRVEAIRDLLLGLGSAACTGVS